MTLPNDPTGPGADVGDGSRPPSIEVMRVDQIEGPGGTVVVLRGWQPVGTSFEGRWWRLGVRGGRVVAAMLNGQQIALDALPGIVADLALTAARTAAPEGSERG